MTYQSDNNPNCTSTAMEWQAISGALERRVLSEIADTTARERVTRWLLGATNSPDLRLFWINLFIGLEAGQLDDGVVRSVLEQLPNSGTIQDALGVFVKGGAVDEEKCLCRDCLAVDNQAYGDRYVRVMDTNSFVSFLKPGLYLSYDVEDRVEVVEEWFSQPQRRLSDVDSRWQGLLDIVWVISAAAMLGLTDGLANPDSADILNRSLGLCRSAGEMLVYVSYPANARDIRFFQPTVLDSGGNVYPCFVAIKSPDGWGRTCSFAPGTDGLPERVHRGLDRIPREFDNERRGVIGELTATVEASPELLLSEALRRARDCEK